MFSYAASSSLASFSWKKLTEVCSFLTDFLSFSTLGRLSLSVHATNVDNQTFQLHNLPICPLHLLCQPLHNPYCKIKDLNPTGRGPAWPLCDWCRLGRPQLLEGSTSPVAQTAKHLPTMRETQTDFLPPHSLLWKRPCLSTLRLSASFLLGSSETIGRYLASVLICNPNFTELDLSENLLGDTGVKFLRDGLRYSNCKVEKQELWTCHLTGECCQHSCNSLYTNGHLRVLELSASALGDEGMQLFCEGLKRPSCKLQTLRVHHEKRWTGRNTSWNQDCREKYQ
ncbi:hypothetical protein CapIbe_022992 [Capra ibex]